MTLDAYDDQMLDEEWLAAPRRRSRGRLLLLVALAAAVCFLGGALTQKHFGATDTAAASGAGFPSGLPSGLPGGFLGGGGPSTQPGASTSTGQVGGTDTVIGHVVQIRGTTWVVEDLGGSRHRVTVTDATTIVREQSLTAHQVAKGDTVNITGSSSGDRLTAGRITLR